MKKSNLLITIILAISIIILLSILIISFINRSKENNNQIEKVNYASNIEFTNEGQLLAIAYLNDIEEVSSKYITNLKNIKVYQTDGEEKYLIIPRYDNIEINIYEALFENDDLTKGNLIAKTNLPFIITCNISDIVPNIMLEVKYNDKIFEYSPSLSLKDNTINTNEYILNITK